MRFNSILFGLARSDTSNLKLYLFNVPFLPIVLIIAIGSDQHQLNRYWICELNGLTKWSEEMAAIHPELRQKINRQKYRRKFTDQFEKEIIKGQSESEIHTTEIFSLRLCYRFLSISPLNILASSAYIRMGGVGKWGEKKTLRIKDSINATRTFSLLFLCFCPKTVHFFLAIQLCNMYLLQWQLKKVVFIPKHSYFYLIEINRINYAILKRDRNTQASERNVTLTDDLRI